MFAGKGSDAANFFTNTKNFDMLHRLFVKLLAAAKSGDVFAAAILRRLNEKANKAYRSRGGWSETVSVGLRGRWKDDYNFADGRILLGKWSPNQIQDLAATVLAGMARRAHEDASFVGFNGITYLAIGSGLVGWDVTPPMLDVTDTTLTTEYFRKAVGIPDLNFVDPTLPSGSPPIGTASRKFSVVVTLLPAEANGAMREFGLFGGQATGALDSGLIFNNVAHALINKDVSLTITRTIEIEILLPGDCP